MAIKNLPMRAFQSARSGVQRGVTLIELGVVIVILSLLAFALYQFADGGGRGKAVAVLSFATEVANAHQRFKADTNCYPRRVEALWLNAAVPAAEAWCGVIVPVGAIRGPYMKRNPTTGATPQSCVLVDKLNAGSTLCVNATTVAGTQQFVLTINNLPPELTNAIFRECNGTALAASDNATFDGGRCRVVGVNPTAAAGATTVGSVEYLFDELRS